jgi:hypothetical protein
VVGKVNPLRLTPPVPLPVNSKVEFEALVDTVLSAMVTPSMITEAVVDTVVNVPATAVPPPITVPSMVPPLMSRSPVTTTDPVPLADRTRSEFIVYLISRCLQLIYSNR